MIENIWATRICGVEERSLRSEELFEGGYEWVRLFHKKCLRLFVYLCSTSLCSVVLVLL